MNDSVAAVALGASVAGFCHVLSRLVILLKVRSQYVRDFDRRMQEYRVSMIDPPAESAS